MGGKVGMYLSVCVGLPASLLACLSACVSVRAVCALFFNSRQKTNPLVADPVGESKQQAPTHKQTRAVFLFCQPTMSQPVSRIVPSSTPAHMSRRGVNYIGLHGNTSSIVSTDRTKPSSQTITHPPKNVPNKKQSSGVHSK